MPEKKEVLHWLPLYQKSPHKPGVYWFLNEKKEVLYVGKAKDLKNRLASYTQLNQIHGKTKAMVLEAQTLLWKELENEFQALLVEAELIRLHQPPFNILLKDDKTPLYIYITSDQFPKVKMIRKKEIGRLIRINGVAKQNIFGPFSSAFRVKEVLKLIRPIFRWCDGERSSHRACFYYHLGQCSGACMHEISVAEYKETMEQLKKFLSGKTKDVLHDFKLKMKFSAEQEEFEKAGQYRDAIFLIEQTMKPTFRLKPNLELPKLKESMREEGLLYLRKEIRQYFSLPSDYPMTRIEGYDVSNIQGKNAAVSMVVFTDGEPDKSEYKMFNIKTLDTPNDYHMMKEAIIRRQHHTSWGWPSVILIDGGRGQLRSALSVMDWQVPVVSLVKRPDRLVIPVFSDPQKRSVKNLRYHFVKFPDGHPTLTLLEQIRDESHRFAKKQHTRLRNRNVVK